MKTSNTTPATETKTPPTNDPKIPVATFRYGDISAAIFSDAAGKDASPVISIRRSYRDNSGAWQHTNTLTQRDILPVALCLTKCYEFLAAFPKNPAA